MARPTKFVAPKWLHNERPRSYYQKRWTAGKTERSRFEPMWEDLTDYIIPYLGRMREGESRQLGRGNVNTKGKQRPQIINNCASMALRTLVSNMQSGLTSPARAWFKPGLPDPNLGKARPERVWLEGTGKTYNHMMARSNYYSAKRMMYRDLGIYGTTLQIIDEHRDTWMHCFVVPNGSYVLSVGDDGRVNGFMREYEQSVNNMIERFGYERCSWRVKNKYDRGDGHHMQRIIHCVEPNHLYVQGEFGLRGKRWASVYYEYEGGDDEKDILELKGYRTQPFSAPRWDLLPGDEWGIGCAFDSLGDIKGLQFLEQRKAMAIDKGVTPPTQGPPSVNGLGRGAHLPGSHTMVPDPTSGIKALYEVRPELQYILHDIEKHEQRIRRAFFEDILQAGLSMGQSSNVKARHIDEVHEEKMMAFTPVLERLFGEMLDPEIARIADIAREAKLVPPPPESIAAEKYQITYTSPFALLQKAIGVGSIERSVAMVGQIGAVYPEAADKLDPDVVVDEYVDAMGAPATIMRSDEKVAEIRRNRQAQMDQEKAAAGMAAGVEAAKTASETNITSPSLLSQLISGAA